MIASLYGNGLVLLGIWVSMSLVMLLFWGVLAWAVVNISSHKGAGRRWAGAAAYQNSRHLRQTVGDDSGRRAHSGSEKRSAVSVLRCRRQIRVAGDSGRTDVVHFVERKEAQPDVLLIRARPTGI
jgi:hypothetical protein